MPILGLSPMASAADISDEIVITAFKRTENVQDVPATINVFTPDDLDFANVHNTHQLTKFRTQSRFHNQYGFWTTLSERRRKRLIYAWRGI